MISGTRSTLRWEKVDEQRLFANVQVILLPGPVARGLQLLCTKYACSAKTYDYARSKGGDCARVEPYFTASAWFTFSFVEKSTCSVQDERLLASIGLSQTAESRFFYVRTRPKNFLSQFCHVRTNLLWSFLGFTNALDGRYSGLTNRLLENAHWFSQALWLKSIGVSQLNWLNKSESFHGRRRWTIWVNIWPCLFCTVVTSLEPWASWNIFIIWRHRATWLTYNIIRLIDGILGLLNGITRLINGIIQLIDY